MRIDQPISVIIPAYNEAASIDDVLKAIVGLDWIDEIIVVDDASTDRTPEIVKEYKDRGVKLVTHKVNAGKGAAMATGVKAAKYNLFLFLDADLIGLKESHLLQILSPVLFTREADLALGVFGLKKLSEHMSTKIANRAAPSITGQRAIWRKSLPPISKIAKSRYGVDLLITRHIPKSRREVVKLEGLSQVTKEQKNGGEIVKAFGARLKMYQEVLEIMKNHRR